MKFRLIKIGRIVYPELASMVAIYQERLKSFAKIDLLELKDDESAIKLLERRQAGSRLILLDERGRQLGSRDFAMQLQSFQDDPGVKEVSLIVGGPLGLSSTLKAEGDFLWSLSRATFTSDMAWLLCWEQLYRAFNILKGTGYHHD